MCVCVCECVIVCVSECVNVCVCVMTCEREQKPVSGCACELLWPSSSLNRTDKMGK